MIFTPECMRARYSTRRPCEASGLTWIGICACRDGSIVATGTLSAHVIRRIVWQPGCDGDDGSVHGMISIFILRAA